MMKTPKNTAMQTQPEQRQEKVSGCRTSCCAFRLFICTAHVKLLKLLVPAFSLRLKLNLTLRGRLKICCIKNSSHGTSFGFMLK